MAPTNATCERFTEEAMKTRKSARVKARNDSERLTEIERRLREAHGQPRHHNPSDPLDDLIFLVLSRMTQQTKYLRTFEALTARYSSWELVRDAPSSEVEEVLSDAGLAPTKTAHIQAILKEVERREGAIDLSRLHQLPDLEAEQYLTSLPGVSRKTARCVMLYALERQTCPVDTHVWRIMQRLGFAPAGPWSERASRELEGRIPAALRRSLHVTLIAHGRLICRARRPACEPCVLRPLCPSARPTAPPS